MPVGVAAGRGCGYSHSLHSAMGVPASCDLAFQDPIERGETWRASSCGCPKTAMVWHAETTLPAGIDLVVLPGGFSYGDYLRCGSDCRPRFDYECRSHPCGSRWPGVGICNGFQILTDGGSPPGVSMRNANLKFLCRRVFLEMRSRRYVLYSRLPQGPSDRCLCCPWRRQLRLRFCNA